MLGMMLAGAVLVANAGRPSCASLRPAIADQACADTRGGLVIAATPARAAELATLATLGEDRFRLRFRRDVPIYAVVEMKGQGVDVRLDTALKARGVRWRLPWLSHAATADAYRASIARAVTARAQAMRLDAARSTALVDKTVAAQADRFSPAALRAKEAGSLPHELGHGWLSTGFWSESAQRAGDHYGGPAPDWMDEVAAVLMEDDALADSRRRQFAAIRDGTDGAARTRLLDLSTFLSGGHPALPQLDLKGNGPGVVVLAGEEAARIVAAANTFYLQARLFADYVLARSGDPAAFRSAADAFAARRATPEWLARDGRRLHLPATLPALQADWEAWLTAR